MTSNRERDFFIRTYLNEFTVSNIIQKNLNTIARYCYIIHNKENCEPHMHLCLRFNNRKSLNAVKNMFPLVNFDDNIQQSTFVEFMVSERSACRYLLHRDDPDKFQYSENEIVNNGYRLDGHFDDTFGTVKGDTAVYCLIELLNGKSIRNVALTYGKEFIFHIHSYKLLLDLIEKEEHKHAIENCEFNVDMFDRLKNIKN